MNRPTSLIDFLADQLDTNSTSVDGELSRSMAQAFAKCDLVIEEVVNILLDEDRKRQWPTDHGRAVVFGFGELGEETVVGAARRRLADGIGAAYERDLELQNENMRRTEARVQARINEAKEAQARAETNLFVMRVAAEETMTLLAQYPDGSIVPHLLDDDKNPGQQLRDAIARAKESKG